MIEEIAWQSVARSLEERGISEANSHKVASGTLMPLVDYLCGALEFPVKLWTVVTDGRQSWQSRIFVGVIHPIGRRIDQTDAQHVFNKDLEAKKLANDLGIEAYYMPFRGLRGSQVENLIRSFDGLPRVRAVSVMDLTEMHMTFQEMINKRRVDQFGNN